MHLQWFLVKSETHVMSTLRWSYTIELNIVLSTQSPSPYLRHTYSGKTHSNQSQRSLSNTSVSFSIKKERLLFALLPSIFRDKRLKVIAGLEASSQNNSTTCLSMGQPASCAVAMLEGDTGRTRLSEAARSAQT